MKNPVAIYSKNDEQFVMINGYVKSVTERDTYSSVSFKVDSDDKGVSDLISVMCFENKCGINHKKLVADCKGRFLTVFAVERPYGAKKSYVARAISIAPKEFSEQNSTSAFADSAEPIAANDEYPF